MFAIPKHGWTYVKIGDFKDRASYLTDIPIEALNNMILALTHNLDFTIDFDAEGWEFKIISDNYSTYIITNKEKAKLYVSNIEKEDLAKEIFKDISENFEDWSNWNPFIDEEEFEEKEKYKKELLNLLYKLSELLNTL